MSIFGRVKDRMLGRRESLEDIRSYVIGAANPQEQPTQRQQLSRFGGPDNRFGAEEDVGPPAKSYEERELGFDDFEQRRPAMEETKDYDILDRLRMIEAQLSAIRSQTETINERLKNLEVRLTGRRY